MKGSANEETGAPRMAERKRHCKRKEGSDTDADSDYGSDDDDKELLAAAMDEPIRRSGTDVVGSLDGNKDAHALADNLHDSLVEIWDRPVALHGVLPEELKRKQDVCARAKRSPGVGASGGRGEQRGSGSCPGAIDPTDGELEGEAKNRR